MYYQKTKTSSKSVTSRDLESYQVDTTYVNGQPAHGSLAIAPVGKRAHLSSLIKKAMLQLVLHLKTSTEITQSVICGNGELLFPWLVSNVHARTN